MLKIEIIAPGRLRKGPLFELCQEYTQRIRLPLTIHEIETRQSNAAQEEQKTLEQIKSAAFVIALDERGKSLKSIAFAAQLDLLQNDGQEFLQFVLGGADGLSHAIRQRADLLLSFGSQTWPHMLARTMLLEQIYRAQQILSGHPYHRE